MAGFGGVPEVAPLFEQKMSNWCWAACAQMVAGSDAIVPPINPEPTQEEIVTSQLGSPVNQTQNENQIVDLYQGGRIAGVVIRCFLLSDHLTQFELDDQLQQRVPVQMGLAWNGGGRHVSLVVGIEDSDQGPLYVVHDPALKRGRFTYNGLLSAYGRGRWIMSFTAFER